MTDTAISYQQNIQLWHTIWIQPATLRSSDLINWDQLWRSNKAVLGNSLINIGRFQVLHGLLQIPLVGPGVWWSPGCRRTWVSGSGPQLVSPDWNISENLYLHLNSQYFGRKLIVLNLLVIFLFLVREAGVIIVMFGPWQSLNLSHYLASYLGTSPFLSSFYPEF